MKFEYRTQQTKVPPFSEGCQLKASHGHKQEKLVFPLVSSRHSVKVTSFTILTVYRSPLTCALSFFPRFSLVFLSMNSILAENGNHDSFQSRSPPFLFSMHFHWKRGVKEREKNRNKWKQIDFKLILYQDRASVGVANRLLNVIYHFQSNNLL